MAMRWTMHFSYDVYSMVYRTVRGKKARLAITGDYLSYTKTTQILLYCTFKSNRILFFCIYVLTYQEQ